MFSYWEMVLLVGISQKNKPFIAMSSIEAKYVVVSQATKETMCLSSLFGSIDVRQMKPIVIYDDNQSYISLSKNPIFHAWIKHIEIHHHLLRKKTKESLLKSMYCNMKNMVVNILTKELSNDEFEYFGHLIGVIKYVT
jgi:hypothetical protein